MILRNSILSCLALMLASCGSSPQTHFFTLSADTSGAQAQAPVPVPITVAAVHVPASLDRREMAKATGANTVEVDEQDRWTAPLGDMARRVLSEDLSQRVAKGRVILPDAPAPPETHQIVVSISEFGPSGGAVKLNGSWSLVDPKQHLVLQRDVDLQTPSPAPSASGEAAGMSGLLGQLASNIATTLSGTDLRKTAGSRRSSDRRPATLAGRGPG